MATLSQVHTTDKKVTRVVQKSHSKAARCRGDRWQHTDAAITGVRTGRLRQVTGKDGPWKGAGGWGQEGVVDECLVLIFLGQV